MPKPTRNKQPEHPLVGRFFHLRCDHGVIEKQGRVLKVGEGVAIVVWFSWISGLPTGESMVALSPMLGPDSAWVFYPSAEVMVSAYGCVPESRRSCGRCIKELKDKHLPQETPRG